MLEKVNFPSDLKGLSNEQLVALCDEIRCALIEKIETTGGHMGSNLGVVELTVALHTVFDTPKDKIVFDVSHQTYPHKMLTGRKQAFLKPYGKVTTSGYTNPSESEYDLFRIGHTSTSISLAFGLAKARQLRGGSENVVAVIGDGSLSGGEALEGLNNASVLKDNFIIIVNDNEMSIAENTGGIYKNLKELRETNGKSANNMFKALGFDYCYLDDGNDVIKIIELLSEVKGSKKPVVVHIHTLKGKGSAWAELNKELGHYKVVTNGNTPSGESYTQITADYLIKKIKSDKSVMVVNAATPGVVGLTKKVREELKENYIDVGIAEEHAVATVSGAARGGAKPVLAIMSNFMQRTYDQLLQDLALNKTPATILVFGAGLSASDETHVGSFDIPMVSAIPNTLCFAPTEKGEYLDCLDWAIEQTKHPVIIRVPDGDFAISGDLDFKENEKFNYKVIKSGEKIALLGLGNAYYTALDAYKILTEKGYNPTLISPVIYSSLDRETLSNLAKNHKVVVTVEDGVLSGGFGEKISAYYSKSDVKVLSYGGEKEFTDREPINSQLERYRLKGELIATDVISYI